MSAGGAGLPRTAEMALRGKQACTPKHCGVTWDRLLLVRIQQAVQLIELLDQLLVILKGA